MFPEGRALELLIAAVFALIVVGPKDLPILLRKLGQFMARVRSMAAEFRASFDEMARHSELDELRKEVEAMRNGQLGDIASQATSSEMTQTFNEISQGLSDVGVSLNEPVTAPYSAALTQTEHVEIAAETAPKAKLTTKQAAAARRVANRKVAGAPPTPAPAKAKASSAKSRVAEAPAPKAKATKPVASKAPPKGAASKRAAPRATTPKVAAKAPPPKAAAKPAAAAKPKAPREAAPKTPRTPPKTPSKTPPSRARKAVVS